MLKVAAADRESAARLRVRMSDHDTADPPSRPRPVPGGPLDLSFALEAALKSVESFEPAGAASPLRPVAPTPSSAPQRVVPAAPRTAAEGPAHGAEEPPAAPTVASTASPAGRGALLEELHAARLATGELRFHLKRKEEEVTQAVADLGAVRRRLQRLEQDHEELRRRLQKSEMDAPSTGARNVLLLLLPALDDIDAVLRHIRQQESLTAHGATAIDMVVATWQRALASASVQPFDAVGQRFDPMVHEVVAQTNEPGTPAGQVVRQSSRGYLFEGRMLKSARVVVQAQAPNDAAGSGDTGAR
ncbi:MAG: nucleotide exchange factor GrpE [Myxococcales bacterium]|nr:nucleotide exchange factor GrpE [Myxococcales bacterium]